MSQLPPHIPPPAPGGRPAESASSPSIAARTTIVGAIIAAATAVLVALINGWFTSNSKKVESRAAGDSAVVVTSPALRPELLPPASAPVGAASGTAAAPGVTSTAAVVAKPGKVRWEGDVTLDQDDQQHFDLDPVPPRRVADEVDDDIQVVYGMTSEGGNLADYDDSASLALVKGSAAPDYSKCAGAAYSQGSSTVDNVKNKSVICVRTSEGRVASMRVTRINAFEGMEFRVKVWEGDEQQ